MFFKDTLEKFVNKIIDKRNFLKEADIKDSIVLTSLIKEIQAIKKLVDVIEKNVRQKEVEIENKFSLIEKSLLEKPTIKEQVDIIEKNVREKLVEIQNKQIENTEVIANQFSSIEKSLLERANILIDSIYDDDIFSKVILDIENNKINIDKLNGQIQKLQKAQNEPNKILNVDEITASIKNTRNDIAKIIVKTKDEIKELSVTVKDLDIKLDAFIDTVSEKLTNKTDNKVVEKKSQVSQIRRSQVQRSSNKNDGD